MFYYFWPTIQFLFMTNTFACLNIHCVFSTKERVGVLNPERWYLAVQETVHYIEQQLEHHRTRTFQEEYLAFLKKHSVHFDEKYLWD